MCCFRAGFHSYAARSRIAQTGIGFRKYGGSVLSRPAHIKDVLAFARLAINPLESAGFHAALAEQCRGIGAKTPTKLSKCWAEGKIRRREGLSRRFPHWPEAFLISDLRKEMPAPRAFFEKIIDWYPPRSLNCFIRKNWPRRSEAAGKYWPKLPQNYRELLLFCSRHRPLKSRRTNPRSAGLRQTLSTIHSARAGMGRSS